MARFRRALIATSAIGTFLPMVAAAQDARESSDPAFENDIVVTARQREESLQDVPIAVTAVTGDMIKEQQIVQLRDIAAFAPGLNINSDSAGRAFISIRGIGTTVIESVQPGVGIFVNGIYQPNTTYLNSPLVDVARVEVLRGPQGTLFGNNTLGGAINVITRQPGNTWEGRIDGSVAAGDNYASISGTVSGPIIRDVLQFRIGGAYHTHDGFMFNTLALGHQNPLETKSVNGTLRFVPADWATFTINGSYDRVVGGSTPYVTATGPTDYRLDRPTNSLSIVTQEYYSGNVKGEFQVDSLSTKITAVAAYNQVNQGAFGDGDYTDTDYLRGTTKRKLKTRTGELRFDTQWSDNFSTLIGVFASRYTTQAFSTTTVVPLAFTSSRTSTARNENRAIFGTAFLTLGGGLDLAAGIRYDHQNLKASTSGLPAAYIADEWQPRVTLTKRWSPDFMTYASIARGVRGGGQNGPGAPNLIYKGDSVWTYELGTKFQALDRRLSGNIAVFYNDYRDYIGPNALAPSTVLNPTTGLPVGFVAVNLNSGNAENYGVEAELTGQITRNWRVYGNLTLLHARVTDSTQFRQTTGYDYPGDLIPWVPSVNYAAGTNYRIDLRKDQAAVLDLGIVGKGRYPAQTLDAASIPFLDAYSLVNASIGWETRHFTVALFSTNLFDTKYIESYLDKSLLSRAGVPAFMVNNLVIQGNRRRVGLRGTVRF